jgi:hypothetical protein
VVDITRGPSGNVNRNEEVPFEVQNGTQESTILEEDFGCREPRQEVGMVNDDFPNDCFEREEETMDDDDISDSSEEGESEDEFDEEDAEEQNDVNAHAAEALLGLSEVNLDGVQHDDIGGPSVNHTIFEREVHISRSPVNTRNGESEQHVPRLPDNTRIGESYEHYTQAHELFIFQILVLFCRLGISRILDPLLGLCGRQRQWYVVLRGGGTSSTQTSWTVLLKPMSTSSCSICKFWFITYSLNMLYFCRSSGYSTPATFLNTSSSHPCVTETYFCGGQRCH